MQPTQNLTSASYHHNLSRCICRASPKFIWRSSSTKPIAMSPTHNKLNSTHSQQVSSTKLRAKQPTHKKLLLHHVKISRTLLTSFNLTHTFLCFSGARTCHHVNVTDVHASLCAPKQQNMVMFIGMSLFLLVMINFWFLKTKRRRHNQSKLRHAIPGQLAGSILEW